MNIYTFAVCIIIVYVCIDLWYLVVCVYMCVCDAFVYNLSTNGGFDEKN